MHICIHSSFCVLNYILHTYRPNFTNVAPCLAIGLACLILSMDWFRLTQSRDRWQSLVNLVKLREFLNQLMNYKLLRKDSALWSLSFQGVIRANDDLKFVLLRWICETNSLHIQIIFLLGKFLSMGEMKEVGNRRCYTTSLLNAVKLPFEVALENHEIEC